jgi:protein PhnA
MPSKEQLLTERSQNKCELCTKQIDLQVYDIIPGDGSADQALLICSNCHNQITGTNKMDTNHWRCLNDCMWSPTPAVQVMAYRLLTQLSDLGWPQDLLDTLYLEPEVLAWATTDNNTESDDSTPARDSNGTILSAGDTVTIIKDLDVKGAGFTAKRGVVVKNISLTNNPEHIEGRVNGVKLVLKTCFLKQS